MSTTAEPLVLKLSPKLSEQVRKKMDLFGYTDPINVIEDGIAALGPEAERFEYWLQNEVLPACEEHDLDPANVLTSEQVREILAAEYGITFQ